MRRPGGSRSDGSDGPAAAVTRLRARFVWLGPHRLTGPVEVSLRAGRIAAIARARGRVPDIALLPGLVNAHVHLQLPALPDAPRAFVPWLRAVMASQRPVDAATATARAADALRELLAGGCTAVGEIDASGASPAALRAVPLAGRCYRELTGFHLAAAAARSLLAERPPRGTRACPGGWSPHAPYSVSSALLRAAARGRQHLMVHVAETAEEQQFLAAGGGPFAALLASLGRLPGHWRAPGHGAVAWLAAHGALGPRTALVHCQHLLPGDVERIAAAGAPIVVCPGTMAWFGRPGPPVPAWLRLGIPVALGTDSRASNQALSMRAELAAAAARWPDLDPQALLAMATAAGGRALGRPSLGRLCAGGRADLLAVPAQGPPADVLRAFVTGELPLQGIWCGGRPVAPLSGQRRLPTVRPC